jgi:hypothetical protein
MDVVTWRKPFVTGNGTGRSDEKRCDDSLLETEGGSTTRFSWRIPLRRAIVTTTATEFIRI